MNSAVALAIRPLSLGRSPAAAGRTIHSFLLGTGSDPFRYAWQGIHGV